MNLSQYRDLLQDLQDDIDRKENSVLEIANLKEYAANKLENPDNVERYRPVLIEAARDLGVAQAEVEELRALAKHVQRKLGEAIKQTPSSMPFATAPDPESPRPKQRPAAARAAQSLEQIPSDAHVPFGSRDTDSAEFVAGQQPKIERPATEPHSKTVVDQVIDDGSDTVEPQTPVQEPIADKPSRRSSVEISTMPRKRTPKKVSSSSETMQAAGESPLINLKPIEPLPPAEEQADTGRRKKRVSLDSSQTRGTVEFGEEDMPQIPFQPDEA